jgi:hypothetical protein
MRCEKHIDTNDEDFCYKCEELTIKEIKEKYENKFRDNSLQRTTGDKEISIIPFGSQETRGRDSNSL